MQLVKEIKKLNGEELHQEKNSFFVSTQCLFDLE